MKQLIIYGIGAHAKMIYTFFKQDSNYEVVAFTVQKNYLKEHTLFNLPVIGYEEIEQHFSPKQANMFIAVGPHNLNQIREKFYNSAKAKGYTLVSYHSSRANMWLDFSHGDNCMIDNASQSHPFVKIGNNNVIIASNVGHNTTIGNHCFITTSIIGGNVIVEDNVFIGMGCVIQSGVRIGKGSIIGLGSIIKKDVEPYSVYSTVRTKAREGLNSKDIQLFK